VCTFHSFYVYAVLKMAVPWNGGPVGLSEFLFYALLWVLTLAVTSKYLSGPGKRNWQSMFATQILGTAIIVQYYYLAYAVLHFPPHYAATMLFDVFRTDCLESRKGGKVSILDLDADPFGRHPCFCRVDIGWTCYGEDALEMDSISWEMCPVGGTCKKTLESGLRRTIDPYYGDKDFRNMYQRDCENGKGSVCTKENPCTPCEIDRLEEFDDAEPCALCTSTNSGDCGFVEGVGPYCWASSETREVVECTQCCTEYDEDYFGC